VAAASGDTALPLRREFACGKDASDADTARRRQQTSRPRRRVWRRPCKSQVGRAPKNQHHTQVGVCGDDERSSRLSRERTTRRLDRHARRALSAEWCRLPKTVQVGQQKVRAAMAAPLLNATGGPTTKYVESSPSVAAEAQANATIKAGQVQQLTHQQQQQHSDIQQPCQSQRREAVRVERRF
jgi:hypothetical protein